MYAARLAGAPPPGGLTGSGLSSREQDQRPYSQLRRARMPTGMSPAVPATSLEVLDEAECLRLLRREPVGRLGLTASALPVVLPVNFVVDESKLLFATDPGLKLDAAHAGDVACLEIDGYDRWTHTGWSVLATGRLAEITDPARVAKAERLPLQSWAVLDAGISSS